MSLSSNSICTLSDSLDFVKPAVDMRIGYTLVTYCTYSYYTNTLDITLCTWPRIPGRRLSVFYHKRSRAGSCSEPAGGNRCSRRVPRNAMRNKQYTIIESRQSGPHSSELYSVLIYFMFKSIRFCIFFLIHVGTVLTEKCTGGLEIVRFERLCNIQS